MAKSEAPRETAVQLVKDMFPDLGTGFGKYIKFFDFFGVNFFIVEELVGFYRGKTEEIINALLEDNLHPQVASLDRTLKSKAEIAKGMIK